MNINEQLNRLSPLNKNKRAKRKTGFIPYVKNYHFPLKFGTHIIKENFSIKEITKLALGKENELKSIDILFFDTETTGLSTGTGTIPFLVGFGYFNDNGFVTEQFFLQSPSSEYAMLEKINELIGKFHYLASYNGKGFDTHILETRFILNRMQSKLIDMPHIDLLYPCRAFFRRYLGSATLQDIERGILKYTRQDDISGVLIPYVYFDFLRNGNSGKIKSVIKHNRYDILSLAFIIKVLDELMSDPSRSPHNLVSLSTARYLKNKKMPVQAKKHLINLLNITDNEKMRKEAKKYLSMLLKRENIKEASLIWEEEKDELYAILELAKYHEHNTKQIDVALEITRRGLNKCSIMIELGNDNFIGIYDSFLKRERRLINKLN